MKKIAIDYFCKLFSFRIHNGNYEGLPRFFPVLEDNEASNLCRVISDEEVKESIFSIGGLKAPGPDGIPAAFYHNQWEVCGKELVGVVRESFRVGSFPAELNQTLITLVPKVPSPLDMSQIRPISLCNTTYKAISKIIVQRLRSLLPKLISPNQVAFIPRRHIQDNIVVAQEAFHKFKSMKGKKGYVAWKIDLAKAYDRIQWSFIRQVISEVGIEGSFRDLIMWCITSVNYRVVLNGEVSDQFSPGCGIRQGDPLSPYLFVLCMEKLSHLIFERRNLGTWKSIKISRGGPEISHLFFTDDLILFGQASISQAKTMKECLDIFCDYSGQQVSYPKSRVLCSTNVKERDAKLIAEVCDSPITKDLGKYLGVPLIHGRVRVRTYWDIVERTQKRLAAWKMDSLSLAGRVTLIKAVTSALLIYAMQTVKFPSEMCYKLDKINRDFLWGHSSKAAVHLVKWDTVCLPKIKVVLVSRRPRK
ncbi:hypothetical protein LWI29_018508 [Acer saccharum]|uniref:Reverse transcriptase domain-containing protein n=1 Tax=Acer saccharum TaxID=4024 RepID=A0AA39RS90_ACESA|nr:hypothetical protein LWI29_018508 [Acer saccharum]